MKKIILISLLIVILAVGGFSFYLSKMDWNVHKERLAAQLSEAMGKKINFSGNLKVELFPHPQLSANDVEIINPQNNERLAVIHKLDTEITLSSLLKRKPDVQSLSMDGVEVWFKFDEQGISNWHQSNKSVSFTEQSGFNLHNFGIQKSTVHINHQKYNIAFDLTNFNADVQAAGIDGPYRMDGSFLKDNERYGIALSVDSLSQLEDVSMSLAITHPQTESKFRYDGSYNASVDGMKGVLSGQSQRTADWVNSILGDKIIRDEYNEPIIFSADVESDTITTVLNNLVIKFDKLFEGAGKVNITAPSKDKKRKVDIKFQLVNLNFRPLKKLISDNFKEIQKGRKYEPDTNFDLSYDISSERVIVSDGPLGTFENVMAKGRWTDNIFNLDDFYAACPGNIVLSLKAGLTEKESEPNYYIDVDINGQNLLSFINALGFKLKSPKQSSYREADLKFSVQGDGNVINIVGSELKLDKAKIDAKVSIDMANYEYYFEIDADTLNLDNYIFPLTTEDDETMQELIVADTKRFEWIKNNKAEVSVRAKSATYKGISGRNFEVSFVTDGAGLITVEYASIENMLNSGIELSGIINNFGDDNMSFSDVTYDIKSSNIKLLADKLGIRLPKWPIFEQSNFTETGVLVGNLQKILVNSQTKAGEHSFRYDGILNESDGKLDFDGEMLLKTGHMENLLKLLVGNISGKVYRGPLVANAKVKGNAQNWTAENADIQMGIDKYTANVNISESGKIYKITGNVKTTELNLQNWINVQRTRTLPKLSTAEENNFIAQPNFNGDVINYNSYKSVALDIDLNAQKSSYGDYAMSNLKTHISNEQNTLLFQNLSFENKNHKVSGSLQISYAQTPQMKGKLLITYPKIMNLGGKIYSLNLENVAIDTDFETSAETVADMVKGLKGKASVSGDSLKFKGINLDVIEKDLQSREYSKGLYQLIRENIQSGETSFGKFKSDVVMSNGVVTSSQSVFKNDTTNLNVSGSVNLKEWKINEVFTVNYPDLKDIPSYSFSFTGMLNKPAVDIRIEEIANKYDSHWKKIEEEQKQKQEEIRQQQIEKIEELQGKISTVSEKATTVLKEAEDSMSKRLTDAIVDKYKAKIEEINTINSSMEDIKVKLSGNITDEDIVTYGNDIENYNSQLSGISFEIQACNQEDVDNRKSELTERNNDIYSKANNLYNEFKDMWRDDSEQLSQYNSLNYLNENEDLNDKNLLLQENKDSIEAVYSDVMNKFNQLDTAEKVSEKHELAVSIDKLINQQEDIYSQMQGIRKSVSESLLRLIDERRKSFEEQKRQEEEERQKQAEIDAQNLLINNNPNPVVDDLPEIMENISISAEQNDTGNDAIQDNNIEQNTVSSPVSRGRIITQYDKNKPENTQDNKPTGSGLLTPVDGAVQKVSGSISVK
ncbi:MAG: AsmA family protein [Alphaproteobacteria bacterium]|nr:AsmA family protein [Alphaproteobacteria bacterium]